jgi:PKD repeat protein
MKFKAGMVLLTVFVMLTLCGAVSAGTPLNTTQNGTVSGDLYVNTTDAWSSSTQGATNEVTQANTLPNYTSIDSAYVYVNVYSGSGSNNWPVRTTVKLDGNGDGDYDDPGELLGIEDMNIPGTTDGTVYWLNDHCNRVYSDYQVWYNVTDLITNNNPTIYVKTENMGGDGYDGRIKLLALTVAYNDNDTDQVHYWVLNGQDWINTATSPSTSTFNTSGFNGQVESAKLNTVALSGTDGTYNLNNNTLTGNLTETGTYYKEHQWNVTSNITPGQNTNLTYTTTGSSLKMNLATLTIRKLALPVADFTATNTIGEAPLTVTFTDKSTGATGWLWDFNNDGIIDSTLQNPTYTYSTLGSYTVKLTATNNAGSNNITKIGYITATTPIGINWTTKTAWNTPDMGFWVVPCLADLDGDGDCDLLIGTGNGITSAFENTGTTTNPVWTAKPVWNTPDIGSNAAPSCADLDGDGDYDLLIGSNYGIIYAYENTGTKNSPVWTAKSGWDLPRIPINVKLSIADLDGDGDYDVLVAPNNSNIYGYENIGTINSPVWNAKSEWRVSDYRGNSAPFLVDLDGDEDYDLIIGSQSGTYGYRNIGTTTNPVWTAKTVWNAPNIYLSVPCLSDLDGDGDYDLLIGGNDGYVYGYENTGILVSSPDITPISVNPAIVTTNTPWTITATINNTSSADVGAFIATLSVNGVVVDTQSVLGPKAGRTSIVNFSWTPKIAGSYSFTVTVDPLDGINETNETNNILTVPVDIVDDTQAPTVNATPQGGNLTTVIQVTLSAIDNYDTNPLIYYTTNGTNPTTSSTIYTTPINISKTTTLKFIAVDFGGNISPVQIETYSDNQAPNVTPNPDGGTSTSMVQVTLSATDNLDTNPKIYYTTNGDEPTTNSTPYTIPINIPSTTTLKFIAVDISGNIAPVRSETYTINDTNAPTVNATPSSGLYNSAFQVTLTGIDDVDPNPKIYYTINGTEPSISSTQYNSPLNIIDTTILKFIAVDASGNISPVQTETYNVTDTYPPNATASLSETTVTLSAADNADPNPKIYYTTDGTDPTTSSTPYNGPFTIPPAAITMVKFIAVDLSGNTSPLQSKTFNTTKTTDIMTGYYAEGNIGIIVSNGGTGYTWFAHNTPGTGTVTYTASDLNIPEGATILSARLYQAWTWYGYPGYTLTFNGNSVNQTAHYADGNDGQDVFDVTPYFNLGANNTAVLTSTGGASYATILIVVYQLDSEPYKEIWVNEGFDIIPGYSGYGATEGPGHAYFNNATTDKIVSAQITISLPSGDNDAPSILLNGQTLTINSTGGSDPSFKYYNITTAAIQNGTNIIEVPNGGYMSLANAILTLTYQSDIVANFTADKTNGITPLTVQFTDQSTNATSWSWDFNNDGIIDSTSQNPTWTYTSSGNYTVKLTVTGPGGIDAETKTNYISAVFVPWNDPCESLDGWTTTGASLNSGTVYQGSYSISGYSGGSPASVERTINITDNSAKTLRFDAAAVTNYSWSNGVRVYLDGVQKLTIPLNGAWNIYEIDLTGIGVGNHTFKVDAYSSYSWASATFYIDNIWVIADKEVFSTINITPATANVLVGDNVSFTAKAYTQYGEKLSKVFTWTSSNETVGIIDTTGRFTALGPGTTIITATADGINNTAQVTITQPTPVANFTANTTLGTDPLTVQFTDTSSNNPTSWAWDFDGDGIVDSTIQNPVWTYNTTGVYSVSLTAGNSAGNNTVTKADLIRVGKPDLTVTNLELPSNPVMGTNYTVNATITNNGLSDAGPFTVKLQDGTAGVGWNTITSLAAGMYTITSFNWTPASIGTHTLKAAADYYNTVTESNENNNKLAQDITVLESTRPDLTISNIELPLNPVVGETYKVNVTVTNNGATDAGSFTVKLQDGTTGIGWITINNLAAQTNTTITFNWKPTTNGTHTLKAAADYYNTITESNENNNKLAQDITVSTKPDLTISNIELPLNPVVGETYKVNVTVTNNGASDAGSFTVKLQDGTTGIGWITINNLAAQTDTTITFNWKPTTNGTHTLKAAADYYNTITESNENNNKKPEEIIVT